MKTRVLLTAVGLMLIPAACSSKPATTQTTKADPTAANPAAEPKLSEARPPTFSTNSRPDTGEPVKFPFPDFPKVEVSAKAGDYVLAPSYNWISDAADKGVETTSFIWYVQKMAQPEKDTSELQFLNERRKVPNAYIIAIPSGQTAKKGDIVLTWWQTGSGMQRAIVTDDSDPVRPIVRYLDIAYDNPAKSRDGSTTIGKMDERLVPDSFFKMRSWDPGTTVIVQDGASQKLAKVIRVADSKILAVDSGGKLKVYSKNICRPAPLVPDVKAGDRVQAPRYGQIFASANVSRVEASIGRIFVRFEFEKEDRAIAFGDVVKN